MIFVWVILLAAAVGNIHGTATPNVLEHDSTRTVGGYSTSIDRFPSLVQVEFRYNFLFWYQVCAGSLLTQRHVLSGAQCFTGFLFSINQRRIRAGSSFRNVGGVVRDIRRAINHPTYGNNNYDGDITILELRSDLTFSDVIRPVLVAPPGFETFDNLPVVHAGWGNTKAGNGGSKSEQLRAVQVPTINHAWCTARYASLWRSPRVTNNMVCVGILNAGGDTCEGDEGGPMYFNNDILVGIVSWGRGCTDSSYPRVNTKVSAYTNWIYQTTAASN